MRSRNHIQDRRRLCCRSSRNRSPRRVRAAACIASAPHPCYAGRSERQRQCPPSISRAAGPVSWGAGPCRRSTRLHPARLPWRLSRELRSGFRGGLAGALRVATGAVHRQGEQRGPRTHRIQFPPNQGARGRALHGGASTQILRLHIGGGIRRQTARSSFSWANLSHWLTSADPPDEALT